MSVGTSDPQYHFERASRAHSDGDLDAALTSYRAALALRPDLAVAHVGIGAILHVQGRLADAAASYRRAIESDPGLAEAHYNLGNALRDQGDAEAAIASYRSALSHRPDFVEACNNLGVALQTQGRLDEAIASFRNAIAQKPDHVMACFNLGTLLQERRDWDGAIASYRQALSIKSEFPEALNNLGVVLESTGRSSESIGAFLRAVELKPDYAVAHDNLGTAHRAAGKIDAALACYQRALALSDSVGFKEHFVGCVRNYEFHRADPGIRALVLRAITEHWGWQSEMTTTGVSLVKCDRAVNECIERAVRAWPRRLDRAGLFETSGMDAVANDALFRALLNAGPVCDIAMERFLTMVRRVMLEEATAGTDGAVPADDHMAFRCAVAAQCFNNEYIYAIDEREFELANILKDRLGELVRSGAPVAESLIIAVASYWQLSSIPMAALLLEQTWPEPLAGLLVRQIAEPLEEARYRTLIPRLTEVGADVSTSVRRQYEENPYPRWTHVPPAEAPLPIDVFLARQFPNAPFVPIGDRGELDILIAGCGTGLEPILRARQLANARLLAIDLSLPSISYAKRKTRELGLSNIEYAQADITELRSLGRTFDVVESTGVLHHLAEPLEGMRALVPLVRPGGLMYLGLYSEHARESIVEAKAVIASRGYEATDVAIRECRQELLQDRRDARFEPLFRMRDFHVMSECRDLLFHVQEHRFTLPQTKEMLGEFGLTFIGFSSLDPSVIKEYEARFIDDPAHVNLDYWGYFEDEFPGTFVQMYQFWVQKPA
jgi:Tfp pilus assembly protein PilF/2-polyprenyl-3-methyl-5-hydroxy-6-metoxy-1,4-benzoquinol methylase